MLHARRTEFLFVHGEGDPPLVTSVLCGETRPLELDGLTALFAIPHAHPLSATDSPVLRDLAERGLVLLDLETEPFRELRRRDELLQSVGWLPAAAAYHFSTRLQDSDLALPHDPTQLAADAERAVERFVQHHGPPPSHFHSTGGDVFELPHVETSGGLYESLSRRRTTRGLDPESPVSREQLAVVLAQVFGCRGATSVYGDVVVALRRGSPSAGGLHPVEVYPLVRNVNGIRPGLYHYRIRDHVLELVTPLDPGTAAAAISSFTTGQLYLASAAAAFLLTGRFERTFWKYRRHPTAYASVLMDAAHLSQTFYLVCAELGLGAYFTNLVNAKNIERALGLDGYREGALAVCGCGMPSSERSPLDPEFLPYVPGNKAI